MVGYAFLNKKEFHPGSFNNIERVAMAEEREREREKERLERKKLLEEEKYEEELKRLKV